MTMKKELEFCKYYKGEKLSPFKFGTPENSFWSLEKQYFDNSDFNHAEYERTAKDYIKAHPNTTNFMTSDAPIEQKGFVMFAEEMLSKWDPTNANIIFKYLRVYKKTTQPE